jgi:Tol biopolymer transport system component
MIRSLDSPVANQIGHGGVRARGYAIFSNDGTRLYYTDTSDELHRELWTVALAGGKPERLFDDLGGATNLDGLALAPDGESLVIMRQELGTKVTLWISSPPGTAPRKLDFPAYQGSSSLSRGRLAFSPDGRKLLTTYVTDHGEYYLSSWPVNGHVHRVFAAFDNRAHESGVAWMADCRHVLLTGSSNTSDINGSLYMGDTISERIYPLDLGHERYQTPAVSHDGKVLLSTFESDQDIVEIPLDGSAPHELIATRRNESYPDWSRKGDRLVYVTDRNGSAEIWLRSQSGDWTRPLVTQAMFPGVPATFRTPVFSPDGQRIAFVVSGDIWIMPVSGGLPTRVGAGFYPAWSPDGEWLAFLVRGAGGKFVLQKRRLGSMAPTVDLIEIADSLRPMWSGDGKWITVLLPDGLGVTTPDGSRTKLLVRRSLSPFAATGWSRDGKTLYLADRDGVRLALSAIDPESGTERLITEYRDNHFNVGERFIRSSALSPSPDGHSLTTTRRVQYGEIWMIEGIEPPRTFWQRLLRRR